jgi:hypothetical protein
MTIQQPPNDEIPPETPIDTPDEPIDIPAPAEPEQRAPGAEQPPVGAPTDEPDLELD